MSSWLERNATHPSYALDTRLIHIEVEILIISSSNIDNREHQSADPLSESASDGHSIIV